MRIPPLLVGEVGLVLLGLWLEVGGVSGSELVGGGNCELVGTGGGDGGVMDADASSGVLPIGCTVGNFSAGLSFR